MAHANQLPVVTLYGRAGCHLCDQARRLLARWQNALGYAIAEVDIDANHELLARYNVAVPVVVLGGEELARAPIDAGALRERLRAALQRHSG